ncbi:MAG: flagellar motor protein MotA [Proteobacteria bacterium]|nr:flagellar motor protein MotA [Pseudomonadota bacterium]
MATLPGHMTLTRPQVFFWRMIIFLILVAFLVAILYTQTVSAFMTNPGLNGLIVGVLFIGIAYAFRQIVRLFPEIRWVNNFRIADPGLKVAKAPVLLAPMATMLRDRTGHVSLSTLSMRSILDSIGSRLDEARDISRYLVGLLIFLGLLGTFWGLLDTINAVGQTIATLNTGSNDGLVLLEELKEGLAAPLKGMGTAFSSSLFGLAGSLVLGFLDLQAGQAQNRFYNELEDWLSGITELQLSETLASGSTPQLRYAMLEMQRSISTLGANIEKDTLKDNSAEAVRGLAAGVEKMIEQMRAEQKIVREWADEQAELQRDMASIIKDITENADKKSAPRTKSGPRDSSR